MSGKERGSSASTRRIQCKFYRLNSQYLFLPGRVHAGTNHAEWLALLDPEKDFRDSTATSGFDRQSTLTASLVSVFYGSVFPSHPFVIPEKLYQKDPSLLPDHLIAAMCILGSSLVPAPFVTREVADSFQATAAQASLAHVPDDGFKVQSLILLALSEYANNNRAIACSRLNLAVDLALLTGMNRMQSATAPDLETPAILDEMWNRTWWELYFIAGLFSASGSTSSWMRMSLAPVDRPLPGHCREYIECLASKHTPPELRFYRRLPPKRHYWSTFAFRVASIHLMGKILEWQSQTRVLSPPLASQAVQEMNLLVDCMKLSGNEVVKCDGRIDEQLFSTSMILHLTRILLDWPEAGDILRKFPHLTDIGPDFMTTASCPNEESISAAHGIINLIPLDLKLYRRTPCFGLALGMAAILYGVRYAQALTATQSQNARSALRLAVSALRYLGEAHQLPLILAIRVEELATRHTGDERYKMI
ncbi:uncharacterized protein Z519_07087 [Cladophialophora bantiana CBS 173.52]|uniref:Xylanolytic transcriptional activator regulatory domain-containing protein n=1 Tax=Cladophialophora bantiana (strain ATCC 10958 / CBS 173.52 / CDC B-1940 / NIH 8579) TaxID=1442370 RepID=A0A0D2HFR9_CLAB1|nr:uncharacterized protein Z519_07087 [Cladophialophora bantiana CBS 173.52]KIW92103.1 hypothetical protein Z519_07087 [Cladophialophora bantiana CBS 173.52]